MNITRLNTLNDDKVIVRGNGGNSGGGSGENTYEYIDVRGLGTELKAHLAMYALAVRVKNYTMPITELLVSTDNMESVFNSVVAVMLDLSFVMDLGSEGKFETRDFFSTIVGIDLSTLPRLTKEEFYNLNA